MTPLESLHSAIAELAYATTFSEGELERTEAAKFLAIVASELHNKNYDFDITQIIFEIMVKDRISTDTSYNWAMHKIKTNSHYLSPELKGKFIRVMKEVAKAFPPEEEIGLLERFRKDIGAIHGDSTYY
jgi:hypothetical protein